VLALALSAGPVGVFLMLRRMSLVGDAMSHAIWKPSSSPSQAK
jgi:zinc/manganese transport system permease protein